MWYNLASAQVKSISDLKGVVQSWVHFVLCLRTERCKSARAAGRTEPDTTCNQAREIVS
jgi:hypothetical protein